MYKRPMAKPKGVGSKVGGEDGWGRGEWWEENVDNCSSTTKIKNK